MLHLRAAVDPVSPLNKPGQPQSFSLRLTDGAGKTATVTLTGEPALAFPAGVKEGVNSFNLDTWDNTRHPQFDTCPAVRLLSAARRGLERCAIGGAGIRCY